jgi:hypothetical protein
MHCKHMDSTFFTCYVCFIRTSAHVYIYVYISTFKNIYIYIYVYMLASNNCLSIRLKRFHFACEQGLFTCFLCADKRYTNTHKHTKQGKLKLLYFAYDHSSLGGSLGSQRSEVFTSLLGLLFCLSHAHNRARCRERPSFCVHGHACMYVFMMHVCF